ncbi:MAG: dihydrofolate reductase [Bacteroidia bacterium]|nr:dihydrofolate reductase [Bacteroidia bacterium]
MKISIIVAIAENLAIGKDNNLLWRISDDLKLFKRTTLGHVIVMGRKSYESIGRPLPGRTNVVVTRKKDYQPEGVQVFSSLTAVFEHFSDSEEEIFVIGGGEIYRQTLDDAHILHVSHVQTSVADADTFFPKVKWDEWNAVYEEDFPKTERNEFPFRYRIYKRVEA